MTASTGTAASAHEGGVTLSPSVSAPPPRSFVSGEQERQMRSVEGVDVLVIEEVSMIRADMLDLVDTAGRLAEENLWNPSGVQVIFCEDFSSFPLLCETGVTSSVRCTPLNQCWACLDPVIIELTRVFRQRDPTFARSWVAFESEAQRGGHCRSGRSGASLFFPTTASSSLSCAPGDPRRTPKMHTISPLSRGAVVPLQW